jgi:hypothetical protein
MDAM